MKRKLRITGRKRKKIRILSDYVKSKYIALIDCDSFFVSCERTLTPELKGLPVSVVSGERGCVLARSREAKALGVPMGIPLFQAVEKYPQCIYLNANHYNYAKISRQVMSIIKDYSPSVEIYSIDEAFVDLTGLTKLYKKNYFQIAKDIQQKVLRELDIPVTIGISRTKTLAKLASDKAKNTSTRISLVGKAHIHQLLWHTDIQEVWGIGKNLGTRLKGLGIRTALDYVNKDNLWIKKRFGKNGLAIKSELLGWSVSPINSTKELPKSISDTKSFVEFSSDLQFLKNELAIHIHEVCTRLRKINCKCSTVGIVLKTKDFYTLYEKVKLSSPADFEFDISGVVFPILEKLFNPTVLYRSIGVVVEDIHSANEEQLLLFSDNKSCEKMAKLGQSLDKLEQKFGRNIVSTGFVNKNISFKQGFLTSPNFDIEDN